MTADPNCIFCKIVAGVIPCFKLHEDAHTLAFMDINPANDGHALVVPKIHARDLYDISAESIAAVATSARRVARAVDLTVKPEGLNLVQCNGEAAGQSVSHFHMHVLPRTLNDELQMNWGLMPGDMAAVEGLAERIRANMDK
jgi:histidine triad (HIT) family protein